MISEKEGCVTVTHPFDKCLSTTKARDWYNIDMLEEKNPLHLSHALSASQWNTYVTQLTL